MEKIWRTTCVLLGAVLTGCASQYRVPADVPKAEFSAAATSTPAGKTTRSVNIVAIADEKCSPPDKNGLLVAREFVVGNPDVVATSPVDIPAETPFHFYVNYGDSRFAQNKVCTIQASFTPSVGRKYKGVIILRDDVRSCDFGLYDVTSGMEVPAPFAMPETFCPGSGQPPLPNGRAVRTIWRIQYQ